jgi:hypothetical protein
MKQVHDMEHMNCGTASRGIRASGATSAWRTVTRRMKYFESVARSRFGRTVCGIFLGVVLAMACDAYPPAQDTRSAPRDVAQVFRAPLILGASVSADYGTLSPGRRASLRYTEPTRIRAIAQGGTPGVEIVGRVRGNDVGDRSVVIALDLFFWDSTLVDPSRSLAAVQHLTQWTAAQGIPLLLGDIPLLLPGRQPQRARLNQAIRAQCRRTTQCVLVPLDALHQQVIRDGFLTIHGKRYALPELVPDGLHLSPPASEFLADTLVALLRD